MKRVTAYESIDGKIHNTEEDALMADFKIELRGVFQSNAKLIADVIPVVQAMSIIASNSDEIKETIIRYQKKFRGLDMRGKSKTA